MPEAYVRCENLIVGYGKKIVTRDINISIPRGSITTLIGPNGSGKSTILKSIAGQISKISGSVYIGDREISGISYKEKSKHIAVLFAGETMRENMTCKDIVSLGRYPYTGILGKLSDEDNRIIHDSMVKANIIDLSYRSYTEISDGQRQRVLLARALCQEPELLILDEPTTFLDVKYSLEFLTLLLQEVRKKNITVLMSLHDLDMARQISDMLVCIRDEEILKIGTPKEVFESGFINKLFDITCGQYDEVLGRAIL